MGLEKMGQSNVIKAGASRRTMRPYQFLMRPYQLPIQYAPLDNTMILRRGPYSQYHIVYIISNTEQLQAIHHSIARMSAVFMMALLAF
jgi:hypothetical protein